MITNKCVAVALNTFNSFNSMMSKWASFEASTIENFCRVKVGYIHTDGTREQYLETYNFDEVRGIIEVTKTVKS